MRRSSEARSSAVRAREDVEGEAANWSESWASLLRRAGRLAWVKDRNDVCEQRDLGQFTTLSRLRARSSATRDVHEEGRRPNEMPRKRRHLSGRKHRQLELDNAVEGAEQTHRCKGRPRSCLRSLLLLPSGSCSRR